MKISRTGVGTVTHAGSVRDSYGHALLPIQAAGDGVTTFRVRGRVSPDAAWIDIVTGGTADFLQSISWVPFIQLEITAGTGTVTLYIGEE
jgi:hypothetical protein